MVIQRLTKRNLQMLKYSYTVDASIPTHVTLYRLQISSLPKPFRQLDVGQESERGTNVLLETRTAYKRDPRSQLGAQLLKMMIRTKSARP